MSENGILDFHADDYGVSLSASRRIIELLQKGRLDSISIICNMECYREAMALLKESWATIPVKPLISVHINLIDGRSLSGKCEPFGSWGAILKRIYQPGASGKKVREAIKAEISAQVQTVYTDIKELGFDNVSHEVIGLSGTADMKEKPALRLDSHVHTHMIPAVFHCMMDAVEEGNLTDAVSYVRISKEPLIPFLQQPSLWGTYSLVNLVKNLILRIFSVGMKKELQKNQMGGDLCWGLLMSGGMDENRVSRLLPGMKSCVSGKEKPGYLEIICHPGITSKEEADLYPYSPDDQVFLISDNRNTEYNMLNHLLEIR